MNISKTTTNKAKRVGLYLEVVPAKFYSNDNSEEVWIYEDEDDMEPIAIYRNCHNGLFFKSALSSRISEECPYWIESEQKLRDLLVGFKSLAA